MCIRDSSFPNGAFGDLAVTKQDVSVVIQFVEPRGERHAGADAQALAERAGRHVHKRQPRRGMAFEICLLYTSQSQATPFGHDVSIYAKRFDAFGWRVEVVDGHDIEEIVEVLSGIGLDDKPLAIIAKTYKGAGVSFLQDLDGWHGKPLTKDEAAKAIAELQPSSKSGIGVPIPAPNQLPCLLYTSRCV